MEKIEKEMMKKDPPLKTTKDLEILKDKHRFIRNEKDDKILNKNKKRASKKFELEKYEGISFILFLIN